MKSSPHPSAPSSFHISKTHDPPLGKRNQKRKDSKGFQNIKKHQIKPEKGKQLNVTTFTPLSTANHGQYLLFIRSNPSLNWNNIPVTVIDITQKGKKWNNRLPEEIAEEKTDKSWRKKRNYRRQSLPRPDVIGCQGRLRKMERSSRMIPIPFLPQQAPGESTCKVS